MKFEGHIDINKPIGIVAKYFEDPKYLGEYQEGFVKKVLEEGEKGQNGAVSKMYYKNGKYEMALTETIISNKLPKYFEAFYHHKHMDNTMKCAFTSLGENETRYQTFVEYTRIDWFMPKLISILFPGMYKKPVRRWMENFKRFVEAQDS
ncbi:hypothetical protein SAMN05421640_0381 [Ekhidna lutea]|uniref:Polyketide cyclase / dehydrase and lipid transport n=1 Tax=Ekhidna lutea TaxID=447679 RepID=A0A239EY57_EKHLU|nr:SRPBCC family protein [Ekhidna lutea]SNS49381.1 hypothetical protein SAMN05421640_0381 [Ekhidna lutea]